MKKFAAILGLAALAMPLSAREPANVIMPEDEGVRAIFEQFGFSEAVVHGDTVYLSGVVASSREGVSEEEVYDQTWRYIATVLERSGSSLDDVIEITTFHTDLPAQISLFAEVKHRHIAAPFPAWTAIDVDRLFPDNGLVEIKVVARITPADN